MKRIFIGIVLVCCFLLVGCNKSTNNEPKEEVKKTAILTCAKDSEDPIHFTTEMIYYFENDAITNLGVRYTYDLSKYNEEQRKAFADSKLCETDSVKNDLGMTECQEELAGTNYIVNGFATKLLAQSKGTFEQTKTSYEHGGWTCTSN